MPLTDPVDAVFTWVDGRDPAHQRKRAMYLARTEPQQLAPGAASATRFSDSGELWYAIHLLRANAPWLRNIFVVTDNQRPRWLTSEVEHTFSIQLVDHRVIFEGYEQSLPTFNSRAIESMLHRIPGLAEYFLYLNDDFFVLRPVTVDAYFTNGTPVFRGIWRWHRQSLFVIQSALALLRGEWRSYEGLIGRRNEEAEFGGWRFFALAHAPYPIVKSRFAESLSENRLRSIIRHRFRTPTQLWPLSLYANDMLFNNTAILGSRDWRCLKPSNGPGKRRRLLSVPNRPRHLCIQSLDQMSDQSRAETLDAIHRLLVTEQASTYNEEP